METLPVVFRREREPGSILAVFPTLYETGNTVTCYAHIGQHGAASPDYILHDTTPAAPDEYAPLLAELRSIYENPHYGEPVKLKVYQRMSGKARLRALVRYETSPERIARKLENAAKVQAIRESKSCS